MTVTTDQGPTTEAIEGPPDSAVDSPDGNATAEPEADDERRRSHRPWKWYSRIALVAVVYAGALGLVGALGWKLWDEHTVHEAGRAAQQTAVNYAQVLTSIDSNQVDQNFAAVLDGATGEFREMYTKSSAQIRQLLIDNKAAAHGTVVDSAIQSETRSKVVVLLMVDQTVTNTGRPDGRVDRSRMKITMENVGGRWLASKVELP